METIEYDIEWMRAGNQILLYIADNSPQEFTAKDIEREFEKSKQNVHQILQRLVRNGLLRKQKGDNLGENNHPQVSYRATRKGRKKINYLMDTYYDNWIPIPVD